MLEDKGAGRQGGWTARGLEGKGAGSWARLGKSKLKLKLCFQREIVTIEIDFHFFLVQIWCYSGAFEA